MKCYNCNSKWSTSVTVTKCPFCQMSLLESAELSYSSCLGVRGVLNSAVTKYSLTFYLNSVGIANLLKDTIENLDPLYIKAIFEENVPCKIYDISQKDVVNRKGDIEELYKLSTDVQWKDVVDQFVRGSMIRVKYSTFPIISKDGEWTDEYGVVYSKDKRMLIRFPNFKLITEYEILDGTLIIGREAFIGNCYIEKVLIPDSVCSIGDKAFSSCTRLKTVQITTKKYVVDCDLIDVCAIFQNAFEYCISLESIQIPSNIKSIAGESFASCTSLRNVTIPDSVTLILNYAFINTALKSIALPSNLSFITGDVFNGCSFLSNMQCQSANYETCDGILFTKDRSSIIRFPPNLNLTEYKLPDGVNTISDSAFSTCKHLEVIYMPEGVTSIGDGAFWMCTNLKKIYLPSTINYISSSAFLEFIVNEEWDEWDGYPYTSPEEEVGYKQVLSNIEKICVPNGHLESIKKLLPEELYDKIYEFN